MRKRNCTITIRCTEDERRRIYDKARRHNLSLSDYIIRSALGKRIVVAEGLNEVIKAQKSIGNNLNQIALLANMGRLKAVDQKVICEQSEKACRAIQKQTAEQSAQTLTSLISQCESMKLQAGKMSEEYSSRLKSLEEWKSKQGLKMLRAVLISQSVLLILSTALQLWLR